MTSAVASLYFPHRCFSAKKKKNNKQIKTTTRTIQMRRINKKWGEKSRRTKSVRNFREFSQHHRGEKAAHQDTFVHGPSASSDFYLPSWSVLRARTSTRENKKQGWRGMKRETERRTRIRKIVLAGAFNVFPSIAISIYWAWMLQIRYCRCRTGT